LCRTFLAATSLAITLLCAGTANAQSASPSPAPSATASAKPNTASGAGPNASPLVSPSPKSSPANSPTPTPPVTLHSVLLATEVFTSHVNATGNLGSAGGSDQASRFNLSSGFLNLARGVGFLQYGLSAGVYSIPVVGVSGNRTLQPGANTNTYGPVTSAYVSINPNSHFSVTGGYLATFTGQEYTFTYQNANIQRGLVWNMETAVSRGVRFGLTGGKFTGALEVNDGFFSGHYLGLEGSATVAPNSSTSYQFVFVIPNSQAPGNWTSAIANKRLYNFMYSVTSGRWTFQPYFLVVQSPKSSALSYTHTEAAYGLVSISTYTLNPQWSIAGRIEDIANGSTSNDRSPNADLVGYGPGSGAWTFTVTPTYRHKQFLLRADLSEALVRMPAPGLAFGTSGSQAKQFRFMVESGFQI
jgi:hypothetical protein